MGVFELTGGQGRYTLAFSHYEWPAKGNVGGFQLFTTLDPARVRAGRPRLRIDGTRAFGRNYTDPMEVFL